MTCPANISVNTTARRWRAVVTYTAPVGTDNCPGATTTRTAGPASSLQPSPVGVITVTHPGNSGQRTNSLLLFHQ
ncbi:MAG: hypothetical protein IPN22_05865 [Bacteroidetes bacterium]|nr:hypothetical protein [Bacteroidota bacterium]